MTTKLIDFNFNNLQVANPDGSFEMTVQNATVTSGPGSTQAGNYSKSVNLGKSGRASVDVTDLLANLRMFAVRIVFQANGPVSSRQNIVESNLLPFALFLDKRIPSVGFDISASVAPKAHGWRAATTRFVNSLKANTWYTVDLVYDIDTVGLFINGQIVSVHAFPRGMIKNFSGSRLFVGTWVDGARNHFNGKIATLQWYDGIPEALQSQLDERRSYPEWFVTHKLEMVRNRVILGLPKAKLRYDRNTDAYLQHYDHGAIMYQDSVGTAFEMHGGIYTKYKGMRNKAELGYLVSDEVETTKHGGRKSVFSKGAIYWSGGTGAHPVTGQMYLDYEALGESRAIGFPNMTARKITGGVEQRFQGARMYFKTGNTNAHEVHGAILTKYLSIGGPRKWGFPITNESDVKKNGNVVGKFSEFENCTIYWSTRTDAFETHGDIRKKYVDLGGPISELGFPNSDEKDIPNVSGPGKYNTFQKGSLLWYGSFSTIIIARPFKLFIGRINTDESEGWLMGQNDLYIKVTVMDGSKVVYNKKHPSRGDWGGRNIVDVNLNIPIIITPNAKKTVTLIVDVWESDKGAPFGGGDDHLGKWTKQLTMANGWGLRENGGILNSGSFSKINSIKVSVKPQVDIKSLSESEKFWGVVNRGTDNLSYQQYASAYSDVDSEPEWWGTTDWLEKAFYKLVVEDLAENGNCFGMSLEAIYARKASSLFSLPLNRFKNWYTVCPEVNIKQCYQVGSGPIWWFLKEFITGNTHDPKDVFNRTRSEFNRGNHPLLCISMNYDFSSKPHCILPVAWDSRTSPWKITICDPNFPNQLRRLTVNPRNNTFEYYGSHTYRGGEWSGGRLHFMPFSLLNEPPRTPIWDAILLILAGTIVIMGDDVQTESITDLNGNDLDAYGNRAKTQLQNGSSLNGYFVGFKGFDQKRKGTVTGELLMQMKPRNFFVIPGPAAVSPLAVAHLPIGSLSANRELRSIRNALKGRSKIAELLRGRTLHHVVNDTSIISMLDVETLDILTNAVNFSHLGDFRHKVVGRRGVRQLHYAVKHGLSQFKLTAVFAASEHIYITVKDIGTSKNTLQVKSDRRKLIKLEVDNKLGVHRDRIKLTIDQLPVARGKQLDFNLKPGLGGLDVISTAKRADVQVNVEALIEGSTIQRRFSVPLDGGIRLKLSTILSDNSLSVSRIDHLFGPARKSTVIYGH